jgi:sucrose-6-phosphate hydrolase SacC (GH32 family)
MIYRSLFTIVFTATTSLLQAQVKSPHARSGNPVFPGWYADPEGIIFDHRYFIYPTFSAPFDKQVYLDAFSSPDMITWTKHSRILDTASVKWAKRAMWAPSVIEKKGEILLIFRCQRHSK